MTTATADITAALRKTARELLESKQVACVIGYERASDGTGARPSFAYAPASAEKLVFDETCANNLAKYLLNLKGQKVALVVKACDARAVNLLVLEKQVRREDVTLIGVACSGVVEHAWGEKPGAGKPEGRCEGCASSAPQGCDVVIGEAAAPSKEDGRYTRVREMEGKAAKERDAFWQAQFEECVRCYACRQVCPGCYCPECFVDRLDPMWVGPRVSPHHNFFYQTVRALHLAGRCVGCNECERVCPAGLPLSLLNRKLEKEVEEKFSFHAGVDPKAEPPFTTFRKDEQIGIGE